MYPIQTYLPLTSVGRNATEDLKVSKDSDDSAAEILPYVFLGPRTAALEPFINSHGITHVLSVGISPPAILPNVTYARISLRDTPTACLSKVYERAAAAINAARNSGGKILVHCSAGVSRAPSIVTAYLMIEHGMSLKEALGSVLHARPTVNPRPTFFRQLKELEIFLKGSCSLDIKALPSRKERRIALFAQNLNALKKAD